MKILALIPLSLAAILSFSATAADMDNMPGMNMKMDSSKTATPKINHGVGVINSMDEKAAKINLTHEAIPSLSWPAMTMDFKVKDKAMLSKLKSGDKVDFDLKEQPKGQYMITKIVPAKK